MFQVGAGVFLEHGFTDADGNAVDVSSPSVTVTAPDLSVTTATPTHGVIGQYSYTFTAAQAGRHVVQWTGTGYVYSDVFVVSPADPLFLMSLDDAKRSLRWGSNPTDNDDDLRTYMAAVTPVIEDLVGPVLPQTVTEIVPALYDGSGRMSVTVSRTPVLSVTSMTSQVNGSVAPNLANLVIDSASGVLRLSNWAGFYGQLAVVYKAGRTTIPANILLAAREQLRFLWQIGQQANRPAWADEPQAAEYTPSGYAVPKRVIELCAPHMRAPVIA